MIQRLIRNEAEPDWGVPAIARLDVSLLQMLHEIMLGATPHSGVLRAIMARVVDGDGRVVYAPPPPDLVHSQLQAFSRGTSTLACRDRPGVTTRH
jgi:hypothetical protein